MGWFGFKVWETRIDQFRYRGLLIGGPNGIRTRVLALRGLRPRPLDDGTNLKPPLLFSGKRTLTINLFNWGERIRTPISRSRVCRPAIGRLPNTYLVYKKILQKEISLSPAIYYRPLFSCGDYSFLYRVAQQSLIYSSYSPVIFSL